jgi:hypothetical protein
LGRKASSRTLRQAPQTLYKTVISNMLKISIIISVCLLIIGCNSESISTNFKFNKPEYNCDSKSLTSTSFYTFQSDSFNFTCSYPSDWDFQNITDTFSNGKRYYKGFPTPPLWKTPKNDSLFLSKTVMATSWDSTDLSWANCFQVTTWPQEESLQEILVFEEQNLIDKYAASILDKGKYTSNNIDFNWILFDSVDEFTGANRYLIFYCKKDNIKCYIITLKITGVSGHQEQICNFLPLIESFKFKN